MVSSVSRSCCLERSGIIGTAFPPVQCYLQAAGKRAVAPPRRAAQVQRPPPHLLTLGPPRAAAPVPLPEGRVLLASADTGDGALPHDAAVWVQA